MRISAKRKLLVFSVILLVILMTSCSKRSYKVQGYIEGDYTYLASNVSGQLIKLLVDRGDHVIAGQMIFELDNEPEYSELRQSEARVSAEKARLLDVQRGERSTVIASLEAQRQQALATLELSKRNFDRINQLYKKEVVSRADYDQAVLTLERDQKRVNELEANLKEAQLGEREYRITAQIAQVHEAEAERTAAKWKLDQKKIYAPVAGSIFDTFFNEGEQVQSNQPVASMLALSDIKLIFFVPEPLRSRIVMGDVVTFSCDGCKEKYMGKIHFLSSQAEYTPPVIFSQESRQKLVYRTEAWLSEATAKQVYPGQPVDVFLTLKK